MFSIAATPSKAQLRLSRVSSKSCGGSLLSASQCVEDAFRREWLMPDFGTERLQGVIDGDPDGSHGANQAAFADALGAELCRSLRRLDVSDEDVRHLAGHGDQIIGQRSVEQVRVITVDALL